MTVYLRHYDENDNSGFAERWFPFASEKQAKAQGKHDASRGMSVDGIFEKADADSKVLVPKGEIS